MPYNIKKYSDLENLVKTSIDTNRTEKDNLGKLQYDFIYSVHQKVEAAKEALRKEPSKEGVLRLLETAEQNMNHYYSEYIANAADYVITRRAENMVLAGNGNISVSPDVKRELDEKAVQVNENHINYGIRALASYSIVSSIIDGKAYDMAEITNMLVDNKVNQADSRVYTDSHPIVTVHRVQFERSRMCDNMAASLKGADRSLLVEGTILADGGWKRILNEEREPLKLAPTKAVLHLDTLEMPSGTLSLDNYGTLLEQNQPAAARWAKQCFTSMLQGMYGETELEDMRRQGIDPMQGIFIDSKPIKEFFAAERGGTERPLDDYDCVRAAKTIMDGGHTLTVCRMEKEHDGYYFGNPVPAEVRTEIKEEYSLWRAILRFFGLDKSSERSRVAAMTAGDLEAEEAAIAINSGLYDPYLDDLVEETVAVMEGIDRDFFLSNLPADVKDAGQYIQGLSTYDTDKRVEGSEDSYEQAHGVRTMERVQSRAALAALYCLGSGMTTEQVLGGGNAAEKSALGREFMDIMTVQTREQYSQAQGIARDADGFEQSYKHYRSDKEQQIMDMYTEKLAPAMHALEREIRQVNVKDPASLSAHYPTIQLCAQAGIDFTQSSDELFKAHPENAALRRESDYALMLTSYSCVRDYIQLRGSVYSNTGISKADDICRGLAAKAAAVSFMDTLDGRMLDDLTIDKAEVKSLARVNTSVNYSMKQRLMEIEPAQMNAMRGQLMTAFTAKEVPEVFRGFVENIRTENYDLGGIAKLPVSNEDFVKQFTPAASAKKSPAPTISHSVQK